ncbi:MAG: hypothetical protein AAFP84_10905 [Actinomycetota bacterium]
MQFLLVEPKSGCDHGCHVHDAQRPSIAMYSLRKWKSSPAELVLTLKVVSVTQTRLDFTNVELDWDVAT